MIEVKYAAKKFGEMTTEEIDLWGDALLLKLHAITGWTIPQKSVGTILADQFKKKLIESYPNCNPDEVEFAFRKNTTQVNNWGKNMNLASIDEVMLPYLENRFEVSRIEEQIKTKPPETELIPMNDQVMIEWLNDVFKGVKENKIRFEFIPVDVYDWLDRKGKITKDIQEKKKYFAFAIEQHYNHLHTKMDEKRNIDNVKSFQLFSKMKEENKFTGNDLDVLKRNAKKMLLFDLIKKSQNAEAIWR